MAGWFKKFDDGVHESKTEYFGSDNSPKRVVGYPAAIGWDLTYRDGKLEQKTYYGMESGRGYVKLRYTYDAIGRIVTKEYLDEGEQLAPPRKMESPGCAASTTTQGMKRSSSISTPQ